MMKKFAVRIVIALMVCALMSTAALAKKATIKSRTISIGVDFIVGETLVKRGTYKFSFNTKTKELSVLAKDKTVVATAVAHLEKRGEDNAGTDIVLAQRGENQILVSIAFHGEGQNIVLDSSAVQTAMAP
jgi:hypothetical protein